MAGCRTIKCARLLSATGTAQYPSRRSYLAMCESGPITFSASQAEGSEKGTREARGFVKSE